MQPETRAHDTRMRLTAIRYAAEGVNIYQFEPIEAARTFRVDPGASVDIDLPVGLTRSYSLINPAEQSRELAIAVKLDANSRGGSRWLHADARVGMVMNVSDPRNGFPLDDSGAPCVFLAGGIGITPIWSMIQCCVRRNRPWELHYGARAPADAAFARDIQALNRPVRMVYQSGTEPRLIDIRQVIAAAPSGAQFYCCGPAPMLAAYKEATETVDPARVHLEYFTPAEDFSNRESGSFRVRLARQDRTVSVPAGESILEVLLNLGMDVPRSCRQGMCGKCETRVLAGLPDHRDSILTVREKSSNKTMMICCSRATTDELVLDL
jgi:vanillate O-demethylase ferredoxin subunit